MNRHILVAFFMFESVQNCFWVLQASPVMRAAAVSRPKAKVYHLQKAGISALNHLPDLVNVPSGYIR